ncbi:MAG: hypothetical protein AABN33_05315 [Acidobacteriota bacterium]
MIRTKSLLMMAMVSAAIAAMTLPITLGGPQAARVSAGPALISTSTSTLVDVQTGCPFIFPDGPVAVAPNQPEVKAQSTEGIINALCDVTLDIIGCGFTPTSIILGCDTNGDGVSDFSIPLKNITVINRLLLQATIPSLASSPGTAFPLACCGGVTILTLTRSVSAGDDNVFGPFTQRLTCSIDLGIRAPVVISATPAEGDCAVGQNLLIPGSCFLLADGKPNVTSVFAVEVGNPSNVVQASPIHILTNNLIDALFRFGSTNAGKTFLIFASGPNGTSRNLTALPAGAPADCPLGNEQGVVVTFKCKASSGGSGSGETLPTPGEPVPISSCKIDRTESGGFTLTLFGYGFREGTTLTIGGLTPKKLKFKGFDPTSNSFNRIVAKGRLCDGLPGPIIYTAANGQDSFVFLCAASCQNQ